MMFLHIHDEAPVVYSDECPVCGPVTENDPSAIITDAVKVVKIDE